MSFKIAEVKNSADLDRFIRLPWKIYKDCPNWVPPLVFERKKFLNPQINPFFDRAEVKLLLVEDEKGTTLGRIALVHDHIYQENYSKNTGIMGMVETVDDENVSRLLFDEARSWCEERGFDKLIGPMSLSINHECGLMLEGFDRPPMLGIPYNPKYYEKHFQEWGFNKSKDLVSFRLNLIKVPEYLQNAAHKLEKRGRFKLRNLNISKFEEELKIIWKIYNAAWDLNWGSVPMTYKEFAYVAREMKSFVNPELCLIAEVKGEPVGFSLALPDINQILIKLDGKLFPFGWAKFLWNKNKIDSYRVLTLGVKKKFRGLGVDAYMYCEMYKKFIENGIKWCEMSWMLEDNADIMRPIFKIGGTIYKRHRIYERSFSS
jgi:ribosomal protein S18 acetylase RimI-like enzyme